MASTVEHGFCFDYCSEGIWSSTSRWHDAAPSQLGLSFIWSINADGISGPTTAAAAAADTASVLNWLQLASIEAIGVFLRSVCPQRVTPVRQFSLSTIVCDDLQSVLCVL